MTYPYPKVRKFKTKCDFCKYYLGNGCVVDYNTNYCREALSEYYAYLQEVDKNKQPPKSMYKRKK